jgi:hypothetical protein
MFPAYPTGATLYQIKPCSGLSATVPLFGNNQYAGSSLDSAYIVQHGSGRNFDYYFDAVYDVIGTNGIIVAPNYYATSDSAATPSGTTWYQPSVNLAWTATNNPWSYGADAVGPTTGSHAIGGGQCSSYDVYDALLTYLSNKSLFPNLSKVYFVSHSAGGNMVSRYSQIYNGNYGFKFRYIVANAANQAYFTSARPETSPCSAGLVYPDELVSSGMPRYVAARFTSATAMLSTWLARDVVTLIGDYDTADRYPGGTQDCGSVAQGGANRRDRNYAWWAYTNIIAGTGADVSAYTGYKQLIASGAKKISSGVFNHQNCVIDGVGHDQFPMFASACGVAAMTQTTIPAGVGAQYP